MFVDKLTKMVRMTPTTFDIDVVGAARLFIDQCIQTPWDVHYLGDRQRDSVHVSVLQNSDDRVGLLASAEYSASSSNKWPNRENEQDPRGYSTPLCWPSVGPVGSTPPLGRVRYQQLKAGEHEIYAFLSKLWTTSSDSNDSWAVDR